MTQETDSYPQKFISRLHRDGPGEYALFTAIPAGPFKVSIQASRTHYCTPRESGLHITTYSAWEVAIFRPDEGWVTAPDLAPFVPGRIVDCFEPGECPVAGWVPTTDVEILVDTLTERGAVILESIDKANGGPRG